MLRLTAEFFLKEREQLKAERGEDDKDAHMTMFDQPRLMDTKAACYIHLGQAEKAVALYLERLKTLHTASIYQQAYIMKDFAEAYLLQENIEEACICVEQALMLATQTGSKPLLRSLSNLRFKRMHWYNVPALKRLDEQLKPYRMW